MGKKTINPRKPSDQNAREYIDNIVAISKKHGMTSTLPASTYEAAVAKATRAFAGLHEAARKPS